LLRGVPVKSGPPISPPDPAIEEAFYRLLEAALGRAHATSSGEMTRAVDLETMGELDRAARAYGAAWEKRKR
jgi:hypothetical protein